MIEIGPGDTAILGFEEEEEGDIETIYPGADHSQPRRWSSEVPVTRRTQKGGSVSESGRSQEEYRAAGAGKTGLSSKEALR